VTFFIAMYILLCFFFVVDAPSAGVCAVGREGA
jgi:hypothetical protein